jgi:hypothetical protein
VKNLSLSYLKKALKMKNVVSFIKLLAFCATIFLSGNVLATPCMPDENGNCISMDVTAGREPTDGGGLGFRGGGGGGGGGGGNNNAAPTLAQLIKNFCIKQGESQQDWADRVYAECKNLTPAESTTCRTIYTSLTIAIGNGGMNPPPIPCP